MTPSEKSILVHTQSIIDGLFMRILDNQAWVMTLHERLAELESKQSSKPLEDVRAQLANRQKQVLQRLLEGVEKMNPSYAAQLDDRDIQDLL
jgi:uncharacterized coiled-coil protein SlyX